MHKKRILILIIAIVISMVLSNNLFADQDSVRDKQKSQKESGARTKATSGSVKDKMSYNVYIGASEGYDNNVYLDSSRKGDMFDQAMADIVFRYRLNSKLDIKARYDFTSITYHRFTKLTMLDNEVAASFEYYPWKNVKVEAGYNGEFVNYPNNKDGDFSTNGPFGGIRYYLNPKTYIGAWYHYHFYNYNDRKVRGPADNKLEQTREDHRNSIVGEIATFIGKLFVKIKNTYYFNESNDQFLDYYDYDSEKIMGYFTYPVTDKLSLQANGGYQYKNFKSRVITTSNSEKEKDNLMILGGGAYYEIFSNFYINASYTYQQNYSNDPIQDYSGSVGTVGINYLF